MTTSTLIQQLKSSSLYAVCPDGHEIKFSTAIIFDGTKPFPKEAIAAQSILKESLEEQKKEIEKIKTSVKRSGISAKSSNVGQKIEAILPIIPGFRWKIDDCRSLGDPIDMIAFNGLSTKLSSITFIEIKSGKSTLNAHQKAVKDAVQDKKVSYKVFK